MEDNRNYTYTHKKNQSGNTRTIAMLVLVFSLILIAIAVFSGIMSGRKKANKDLASQQTTAAEITTLPPETTTTGIETTYKVGKYKVDTGGYSLLFREEPKKDADSYLELSDGTEVEIYEIVYDENATEEAYACWGKADHLGYTGWLAMAYLVREYSDTIVTPTENTTASVTETPEPSVTWQESRAYPTGNYNVSTGGSTLRFKETPSRDGSVIDNLPDGLLVTVTQVVEIEEEDEIYKYWGLVSYNGKDGYVSMAYLKAAE